MTDEFRMFSVGAVVSDKERRSREAQYKKELEAMIESMTEAEFWSWATDSVFEAADGCPVEPDGVCPHGFRSPAILLGVL